MIRVPKDWKETAERYESEGIELAVVGRKRDHLLLRLKLPPSERRPEFPLSKGAVGALSRRIESIIADAARHARRRRGKEIGESDVKAACGG